MAEQTDFKSQERPFSSLVKAGGLFFVSGQVAQQRDTGLVEGDIAAQTRVLLDNLKQDLETAKVSLSSVTRIAVFLVHMEDLAAFDGVCSECGFAPDAARTCFAVSALPHPHALVEIELTGCV